MIGWVQTHIPNFVVSGPKFTGRFFVERGRNLCRQIRCPILDISIRSGDVRDRRLKLCEVDSNFARFWPRFFFGERAPKFWDLDYKTEHTSDHVAKFHGDRPTELGDLVVNKRSETSAIKHKTSRY